MIILNKISPNDWSIIYAMNSYIGANINDFMDDSTLFEEIEALGVKLEWEKENDIFLPTQILKRLQKVAERILAEEWDEFSIITGYPLSELSDFSTKLYD